MGVQTYWSLKNSSAVLLVVRRDVSLTASRPTYWLDSLTLLMCSWPPIGRLGDPAGASSVLQCWQDGVTHLYVHRTMNRKILAPCSPIPFSNPFILADPFIPGIARVPG